MNLQLPSALPKSVDRKYFLILAMVVAVGLSMANPAMAGNYDWSGATGTAWATAGNWTPNGPPTSADSTQIGVNSGVTIGNATLDLGASSVSLTSTTNAAGNTGTWALYFGTKASSYTLQNGTITPSGEDYIKLAGGITLNLNASVGGTAAKFYTLANGAILSIGSGVSQTSSSSKLVLYGGTGTTATMNINAADYASGAGWLIGSSASGTGTATTSAQDLTVNVNANQTLAASSFLIVGWTASGNENKVVIRNGATMTLGTLASPGIVRLGLNGSAGVGTAIGSGRLVVGDATTTGTVNLQGSSGVLRLGGGGGYGTVDIVNGSLTLSGGTPSTVALAYAGAGGQGVINLSGGTLSTVANFTLATGATAGSGILNFNGGTLKVGSGSTAALRGNLVDAAVVVNVLDGGATFDMNGSTDTAINAALLNGGNGVGAVNLINSTGTGKIAFNGVNTYHGATVINAGTLALGASGSLNANSSVSIAAGATFDVAALTAASATYTWNTTRLSASGTGTAAATAAKVTGTAGGNISMGTTPITLTWAGGSSGTDSTHPPLTVSTANLSLGGNQFTVVVPGTALTSGVYTLVSATAISGGSSVNATPIYTGGNGVASGYTGVVSISGNTVILTVNPSTYTVTFDAQGGSVSPPTATVTYNSTYGTLPTPTRTGYTFNGWFTATGGGGS
ncbi:MAG: InlB B-repeat-containing protein, partial [Verrucomicrobiae bacterium]